MFSQTSVQFSRSVGSNSATPWTAACQASLSITNSRSLLKLMSIELVMPSNHLILHHPILLPPLVFPSVRVFSSDSVFRIRWPKYWSFSFSTRPSNVYSGSTSRHQFSSVTQSGPTPWTAALQASLSITTSQSLLKFMSVESVMPSNHLTLCYLLLLLPSIFPSIRVFSNESALCILLQVAEVLELQL